VKSTAIVKRSDIDSVKNAIDAVFVDDAPVVGVGVAPIVVNSPPVAASISPTTVGFIAIGSAIAGVIVGFAICDTLSRG